MYYHYLGVQYFKCVLTLFEFAIKKPHNDFSNIAAFFKNARASLNLLFSLKIVCFENVISIISIPLFIFQFARSQPQKNFLFLRSQGRLIAFAALYITCTLYNRHTFQKYINISSKIFCGLCFGILIVKAIEFKDYPSSLK